MAIVEYITESYAENINGTITMGDVNLCAIHNVMPNFFLRTPKKKKKDSWGMKVAECLEEQCMRCCGDQEDIVEVWNKFNPRK